MCKHQLLQSYGHFQIWPTQLLSGGIWDFLHSSSCQIWVSQSAQHPSPPVLALGTAAVSSGFGRWTFVLVHWIGSTRLWASREKPKATGTVPRSSILGLSRTGPEIVMQCGKEGKASSHCTQGVEQVGQCLEWLYNSGASCFPVGRSCDCHFLFSSSSWEEDSIGLARGSRMFMWQTESRCCF